MDEQTNPWERLHPRMPQFNIEVANIVVDVNSLTILRCYPRGNFYSLIVNYSTLN